MIVPGPEMRCPHCGSREFWPSRKKPWEFVLSLALPLRTYRCRNCLKRYLLAPRWLALLPRVLGAAVAGLFLMASGVLVGRFLWPAQERVVAAEPAPPPPPAIEAPAPVPAVVPPPAPVAKPAVTAASPAPAVPAPRAAPAASTGGMGSVRFNVNLDVAPTGGRGG